MVICYLCTAPIGAYHVVQNREICFPCYKELTMEVKCQYCQQVCVAPESIARGVCLACTQKKAAADAAARAGERSEQGDTRRMIKITRPDED